MMCVRADVHVQGYPSGGEAPLVAVDGPLLRTDARVRALTAHLAQRAAEEVAGTGSGCCYQLVEEARCGRRWGGGEGRAAPGPPGPQGSVPGVVWSLSKSMSAYCNAHPPRRDWLNANLSVGFQLTATEAAAAAAAAEQQQLAEEAAAPPWWEGEEADEQLIQQVRAAWWRAGGRAGGRERERARR